MEISIIIPTCNRTDLLEKCIRNLSPEKQQVQSQIYEVIVSDDSTDAESKKMIESLNYPWVKWINGPKKGPASNRNNGARLAKNEWIVFIDDDCLPDNNLIQTYISALEKNHGTLVFEGCIKNNRPKQNFLEECPINETGGCLWACNFMINKNYFLKSLNGFDENFPFPAMEDVELRERIKKDNKPILFLPEAYVVHPWRMQKNPIEMERRKILSNQYFQKKHPEFYKKLTTTKILRGELRFYIKDVLFKFKQYKGKGLIKYIKAHIAEKKYRKEYNFYYIGNNI